MSSHASKLKSAFTAGLAFIFAVGLNSCRGAEMEMRPIGPDVNADLVVFFKKDSDHDQIKSFVEETISNRIERGYDSLPGIRTTMLVSVDGHQGYAITFFPNATEAQRRYVRSRVDASPIVFKVLENVAPDDIKTLK